MLQNSNATGKYFAQNYGCKFDKPIASQGTMVMHCLEAHKHNRGFLETQVAALRCALCCMCLHFNYYLNVYMRWTPYWDCTL